MSRTVYLPTPRHIAPALRSLGRDVERAVRIAALKAALRGQALAIEASPRASNAYALSWRVKKLRDGAVVGSTSEHAIFVEEGRKPGKPPPVAPILKWMRDVGIGVEVKPYKRRRRKGKRRKTKRTRQAAMRFSLALRIARHIGRRGTTGKYVLKGTIPAVSQHFWRGVEREIDRVMRGA